MFSVVEFEITCDSSGAATEYLQHGLNRYPNGFLAMLSYTPHSTTPMDTAADIVVTTERTGTPLITKANIGTTYVEFYPRALANAVADGAASTVSSEFIPIVNDRIKIQVTNGGNGGRGTFRAVIVTNPPY